jgi:hypothetical protein
MKETADSDGLGELRRESLIRPRYEASVSRIWSAVLVQRNGLGSAEGCHLREGAVTCGDGGWHDRRSWWWARWVSCYSGGC